MKNQLCDYNDKNPNTVWTYHSISLSKDIQKTLYNDIEQSTINTNISILAPMDVLQLNPQAVTWTSESATKPFTMTTSTSSTVTSHIRSRRRDTWIRCCSFCSFSMTSLSSDFFEIVESSGLEAFSRFCSSIFSTSTDIRQLVTTIVMTLLQNITW